MLRHPGLGNLLDLRLRQFLDFKQGVQMTQKAIFLPRRRDNNPSIANLMRPFDQDFIVCDPKFGRDAGDDWIDRSTGKVRDGSEGGKGGDPDAFRMIVFNERFGLIVHVGMDFDLGRPEG